MSRTTLSQSYVHITDDNDKHVGANVSLLPIRTCSDCVHVSCALPKLKKDGTPGKVLQCYACKFLHRPIVRKNWTENTQIIETDPIAFFNGIRAYLAAKRPKLFRYWVGGDFPTQQAVDMSFDVAREYPSTDFLAFTKRWYDRFDFSARPKNFAIVYSAWSTLPVPPNDCPIAWCNDGRENRIPSTAIKCAGRCDQCGVCWYLKPNVHVYFDIH